MIMFKTVSFMMLTLLIPPTFMGLISPSYEFGHYTNNSLDSQTIVVKNNIGPTIEREDWLLDVQWPVIEYWKTTSKFGYRNIYDCPRCSTYHQGLDFAVGSGRAIYNIMDGEIVDVGWEGSYGYRAIIRHVIYEDELEYTTIYAHMQPTEISERLKPGDLIPKGTIIGVVGNTGVSTGPHLHFEVHRNENVLDPLVFFNKHLN